MTNKKKSLVLKPAAIVAAVFLFILFEDGILSLHAWKYETAM